MLRCFSNLGLLLVSLTVCAVAGEWFLRATPTSPDRVEHGQRAKYRFNPYRSDGTLSYTLRPNWETVHATNEFEVNVHTNALGLRGSPPAAAANEDSYRILVVGDSFAFGWGVEDNETFAAQLEQELRRRGIAAEVLNAGVPGYSTDQYLIYLRTRGYALEPDVVLLAPHDNDLKDLAWNHHAFDAERLPTRVESTLRLIDRHGHMRYVNEGEIAAPALNFPGKSWLADHSQLYHWLRFRSAKLWVSLALHFADAELEREAGAPPTGAISSLSNAEVERGLRSGKEFQLRYHRFLMEQIRKDCEARGITLRTLLIARRGFKAKSGDPEAELHADCAADPHCLDTAQLFSGIDEDAIFYSGDGHWTPEGHRRAAMAVQTFF